MSIYTTLIIRPEGIRAALAEEQNDQCQFEFVSCYKLVTEEEEQKSQVEVPSF